MNISPNLYSIHVEDLYKNQKFFIRKQENQICEYKLIEMPYKNPGGIWILKCENLQNNKNEIIRINSKFPIDIYVDKLITEWRKS